MEDKELKNLFSAMFSILSKPQLTKRYIKGLFRGELSMFDKMKIEDNQKITLYSKKEDKYYKVDLDTGIKTEINKSKDSNQNG